MISLAVKRPIAVLKREQQRQKFLALFPRRDQFIWKPFGRKRWEKAKGPLLDHQILGVIADEGRGLFRGCYWSHKTRHAVLDVDEGSDYHKAAELVELASKLAAVGLTAKPYQSSDSGGWHIYLFFDDWEDCSQIEQTLKTWLKAQGYRIEGGQLEVFPSGNALRLPLQRGFGWLDPQANLVRRREDIREDEALASFICDLENNQRNWSEAKNRIESQLRAATAAAGGDAQEHTRAISNEGFDALWNGGRLPERIEEARYYLDNGLTDDGQRHAAVVSIQHLLWFGDRARAVPRLPGTRNDGKRLGFVREWLEQNHNGRCNHINRGDWETVDEQIRRATEWRRGDTPYVIEYEPYMVTERAQDAMIGLSKKTGHLWTREDLERANQKREEQARERIREAVQLLTSQGRRVTVRQLMRLTGCCNKTIKRHSDIHQIAQLDPLPSVGGDLEPGAPGGPPLLVPCSGSEKEKKELCSPEISGASGDLRVLREAGAVVAPPLRSCLAGQPTTCTQHQDQALRVPSEVLTPGPVLRGIQAVLQEGAGGGFSYAAAGTGKLCLFVSGSVRLSNDKQGGGTSSPPGKLADAQNRPDAAVIFVHTGSVSNSGFIRTAQLPLKVACIRCARLQSIPLRLFVYGDVRGPPNCTRLI